MSAFIDPIEARKVAAFVEAINEVCKRFAMDFALDDAARISMSTEGNEPDETAFTLRWDSSSAQYGLGVAA